MKYIATIFTRLFVSEEKKILGRWSIEHCHKKMNNKIDLSNEDHCGPCGQYALDKIYNPCTYNDKAITKIGTKAITKTSI
jgi:hypothetical protein